MVTHLRSRSILILCSLLLIASPVRAVESDTHELAFLEGLSLVVLDTDDVPSLHLARRLIQSYGGSVAIMSPPSILVGWIPYEIRDMLVGRMGIREIYYTEVLPGEVEKSDSQSQAMIGFFNAAVRGEIAAEYQRFEESLAAGAARAPREPDVFAPEAIEHNAYIENLRSAGLDVVVLEEDGLLIDPSSPAVMGNSDYMTGTVALTLFFIESDGTGSDPDQYSWIAEHMQNYITGVTTGLAWWSSEALQRGDCWVSFLINYYSGADPRCQQWVEPILHPSSYESIWVNEIMVNFGYNSGNRFTKVTAFNTWQRSYYETDRAYSAFIPYNPSPSPTMFPGGGTAYAYWYGPYTVLLYRVSGWTTPQVFAHETGHIFGACDEYTGGCSSSSCTSICANGALNANCEACNENSRDCMMKENSFSLCAYTPTHVGWEVTTPCAPPEPPLLPSPTVASVHPSQGFHGIDMSLTITGTDFVPGISVDIGSDVFVHTTTLVDENHLEIDVTILSSAVPGLRNVKVFNRDGQYAMLTDAFEILPTSRHYYSPSGGNNFPYITPADAATSLEDAIEATFDDFSMVIDRGVVLHGAWNAGFTERNLETGKTVLNLDGHMLFIGATQSAGLDGFILRNGTGAGDVTPFPAIFGGAVRFVGGLAVIANCEIESSAAGDEMNYGVGGGIFAEECAVTIRDTYFNANSSTQGGAVYLLDCTGTLSDNSISGNSIAGIAEPLLGAGIAIINSPGVTLTANVFTANTGALKGGGLYVDGAASIAITGGEFANNEASFSGGGIALEFSTVVIDQVEFSFNSSGGIGGGVAISDSPDAAVMRSSFSSNSAIIAGGLYAIGDSIAVRHNLFVGNDASSTGGAVFVSGTESCTIYGNTLDQNTSNGTGGMVIGNSVTDALNNIVVNSTGTGMSTNTSPPPSPTYNLVWNNTGGDYSGCSPGEGSLTADPAFVDPATNDYHLGLHAPAIDSGTPGVPFADPDGSRGDLGIHGSHSFDMEQPSYPKNLIAEKVAGNAELSWDPNPESDLAHYVIYCDSTNDFTPSASNFVTLVPGTDSSVILDLPPDSVCYRISALDNDGYAGGYSETAWLSPPTAVEKRDVPPPFDLGQNIPNPFNPVTRISYELPLRTNVSLEVYDVDGRLVKSLVGKVQGPGFFSVEWAGTNDNGEAVASGVYFYRLRAASFAQTKKMVLLK